MAEPTLSEMGLDRLRRELAPVDKPLELFDVLSDPDLLKVLISRINKNNDTPSRWGVDLHGGGSYRKNQNLRDIIQTGLNVGGRAGVKFPLGDLDVGLGLSGYFAKHAMDFPEGLIRQGAPERISNIYKRLTEIDASLKSPSGKSLGIKYRDLSPKAKELMVRFSMPF